MKRRPVATVRVLHLDHLIEGAVRAEIDCPESTTGCTSVPGAAVPMTLPQLITMACLTHEEQCDRCDTSEAHLQGDQDARAHVQELREALRTVELTRYVREARN